MEKGKYLNLWKDKLSMILSIIKEEEVKNN